MKELYTVGEISKIFNIPTPTLRYYDSIGLLSPWTVGENGYRYYSKAQFEIISTIVLLRSIGTPIKKLLSILDGQDPEGIRSELRRYSAEIDVKIENLKHLKKRALQLDAEIEKVISGPSVTLEPVPRFYIVSKAFGVEDELDIEEILHTNKKMSEWIRTAGIISTITPESLTAGNFHCYDKYGYISEQPCPVTSEYLQITEPGLCVCGNMTLATIEHFEADSVYSAIMDYIADKHLQITGPAIERNVLDMYCGHKQNPLMYFRIYVPVALPNA